MTKGQREYLDNAIAMLERNLLNQMEEEEKFKNGEGETEEEAKADWLNVLNELDMMVRVLLRRGKGFDPIVRQRIQYMGDLVEKLKQRDGIRH